MNTELKCAIMTVLGLLPSMLVMCKPLPTKPTIKLAETVNVDCAFWVDNGHTCMAFVNNKALLLNVDKARQTVLKNMPKVSNGYLCADNKQIVVQTDDGVVLINPGTMQQHRLDIASSTVKLVTIDYTGSRAITTSPAGSSVYDLVSGERIYHIGQNTGFIAESFDKVNPNVIYGDDKQYGAVAWDIISNNVTLKSTDDKSEHTILNPVFILTVDYLSQSRDVYVRIISSALMYHCMSLLSRNRDPLTQHYRFICTFQMDGLCVEDQQTGNRIPLPRIDTSPSSLHPDPSGNRLLIITKSGISVMDIASGKTIYVWNPKP